MHRRPAPFAHPRAAWRVCSCRIDACVCNLAQPIALSLRDRCVAPWGTLSRPRHRLPLYPAREHCVTRQRTVSPVREHRVTCQRTPCHGQRTLCHRSENTVSPVREHRITGQRTPYHRSENTVTPVREHRDTGKRTLCHRSENIVSPVRENILNRVLGLLIRSFQGPKIRGHIKPSSVRISYYAHVRSVLEHCSILAQT